MVYKAHLLTDQEGGLINVAVKTLKGINFQRHAAEIVTCNILISFELSILW